MRDRNVNLIKTGFLCDSGNRNTETFIRQNKKGDLRKFKNIVIRTCELILHGSHQKKHREDTQVTQRIQRPKH